jgi:hypothetical protein
VRAITRAVAAATLLVLLTAIQAVPALARTPSTAQIRNAVRRAEQSRNLWATVNICNSKRYPDYIGIRGQMPALGFAAWLSMDVRLYYYSSTKKTFLPVTDGSQLVRLGRLSSGLQQSGARFQFGPKVPMMEAKVTFIWRRSGRLLGQVTRTTTGGHPNADFSSPPRYSAARCTIS